MAGDTLEVGTIRRLNDGGFEGTFERVYAGHEPAEVRRMLTEPALLAQWLAPGAIEPRRGGRAHIDFAESGIVIDSEVLAFDPSRVLAYSWSSRHEPQRRLTWTLAVVANGTRLTLGVHTPAGEDPAKACGGFEGHLEMLAAALEGVPIKFPLDLFLKARAAYNRQLGK